MINKLISIKEQVAKLIDNFDYPDEDHIKFCNELYFYVDKKLDMSNKYRNHNKPWLPPMWSTKQIILYLLKHPKYRGNRDENDNLKQQIKWYLLDELETYFNAKKATSYIYQKIYESHREEVEEYWRVLKGIHGLCPHTILTTDGFNYLCHYCGFQDGDTA